MTFTHGAFSKFKYRCSIASSHLKPTNSFVFQKDVAEVCDT